LSTSKSCSVVSALLLSASLAGAQELHHGVCFAHTWRNGVTRGYGSDASRQSLARLRALGVDAVSLTPFGYLSSLSSPDVQRGNRHRGGETDEAVAGAARQARALGMRVMLKPHLWVHRGDWIGKQVFADDAAFARWFDSYSAFIKHYASLAAREKMEWLVIGTELVRASGRDRPRWQALIAELRRIYPGKLTYAANWDESQVVFWDLLDAIGVQAYEPIGAAGAGLDELRAGWKRVAAKLEALSRKHGKPVIVTELGYRAAASAASAPHAWPESDRSAAFDGEQQARCYRAALEALLGASWCGGVYVWKWFSDSSDEQGPTDFSPAGKPAEKVLGDFYRRRPSSLSR
jgi:hypothetical protein